MAPDSDDLNNLRQELKFRRELDDEWAAEEEAERQRAERWWRWEERRNRLLRSIGYPTRILVYLIILGLLWVLAYAWFDPKDLTDRPLASLTLGELLTNFWWALVLFGGSIMLIRAFFAEPDGGLEMVDWEDWGVLGLVLLAIAALLALWLTYG